MDLIVDGYNVIFKIPELGYSTEKCDIEILRNRFLPYWSSIKRKESTN